MLCNLPAPFPHPTDKLRPREWWSAQGFRAQNCALTIPSCHYCFLNHPTSVPTMNYWIWNVQNFQKWHWCVSVFLHQITAFGASTGLYFQTGSKRASKNINLVLHNEGRLATKAGGQNTGFGLCNPNNLWSSQASLQKVASDQWQ